MPDIEALQRKLARAEAKGKAERVADLRARIAALAPPVEEAACHDAGEDRLVRLQRKLAKAEARGNAERVSSLRLKIAGLSGDTGHDDEAEVGFQASHGARPSAAPAATAAATSSSSSSSSSTVVPEGMVLGKNGKLYPKPAPLPPGNTSLLLFYAYVQPPWAPRARSAAIEYANGVLSQHGCTGRLRVALEGFNGTLTGPQAGMEAFCQALREYSPEHFGATDFKLVHGLQDNKRFRALKVWPVEELVTYGFSTDQAPLAAGGKHVKPAVWTAMAAAPNTVMIDVRNANESAIGRFAPPAGGAVLLDPRMRRSTEFSEWVDRTLPELEGKTVMMYCTGGVRW